MFFSKRAGMRPVFWKKAAGLLERRDVFDVAAALVHEVGVRSGQQHDRLDVHSFEVTASGLALREDTLHGPRVAAELEQW